MDGTFEIISQREVSERGGNIGQVVIECIAEREMGKGARENVYYSIEFIPKYKMSEIGE